MSPMVTIEVSENSNCEASELRVFHDVEAPKAVSQVCLERSPNQPEWYEITGWTTAGQPCTAFAQCVDDSGEGLAILVHGGTAGLRIKPAGSKQAWSLQDPQQWGAPFFLIANDGESVVYSEVAHG